MSDNVKKSPACKSLAVIPIDGSCVFAPNKELVPTKNGELKLTVVRPLDVCMPDSVLLCKLAV